MRILHCNKFLYRRGGAEAYMEGVATLQQERGHEVAFFGMTHPANPALPYAEHFPDQVEFDRPVDGVLPKARAFGRMLYSSSARRGMAAVVADFRPDVVHLHNIYHSLSPSILRPLEAAGVPTVMTLHDYKLACPTYRFLDKGEVCEACLGGNFAQATLRRCKDGSLLQSAAATIEMTVHRRTGAYGPIDIFISPSRFLAQKMVEAGVYPDRMRVVNHFVDTSQLPAKTAAGGPIVFAGRLSHEKGVDVLIEAVALLGPGVKLEVAGEGAESERLEALADRLAPGQVHFHGRLPRSAVLDLIRSATVSCLPSRWYENQPMAVLESLAIGVPVVATALGGHPELVQPGRTGELVPPNDARALADALRRLIDDPDRAMEMGRRGRAVVERDFSPDLHVGNLEEMYREAGVA